VPFWGDRFPADASRKNLLSSSLAVNLSAKVEYAAIAVLELALRHGSAEPVRLREISELHGIPSSFLVQILLQLKSAGVIESTRGAAGGYRLMRSPADLTLGEIRAIVEGGAVGIATSAGSETPVVRCLLDVWQQVDASERQQLAALTFAELADRCRAGSEQMYYI
jgi:Rrf2 family protein